MRFHFFRCWHYCRIERWCESSRGLRTFVGHQLLDRLHTGHYTAWKFLVLSGNEGALFHIELLSLILCISTDRCYAIMLSRIFWCIKSLLFDSTNRLQTLTVSNLVLGRLHHKLLNLIEIRSCLSNLTRITICFCCLSLLVTFRQSQL